MVILDTDHVSLLERVDSPEAQRLSARLERLSGEEMATTIISYEEQTRGWLSILAQAATLPRQIWPIGG